MSRAITAPAGPTAMRSGGSARPVPQPMSTTTPPNLMPAASTAAQYAGRSSPNLASHVAARQAKNARVSVRYHEPRAASGAATRRMTGQPTSCRSITMSARSSRSRRSRASGPAPSPLSLRYTGKCRPPGAVLRKIDTSRGHFASSVTWAGRLRVPSSPARCSAGLRRAVTASGVRRADRRSPGQRSAPAHRAAEPPCPGRLRPGRLHHRPEGRRTGGRLVAVVVPGGGHISIMQT